MENIFSLKIRKDRVVPTIKNAGGLAIFIAIFSLIINFIMIPNVRFESFDTILVISTSAILLLLGLGVLLKNRFSAVALVVVYIIDRILNVIFSSISGNEIGAMIGSIIGVFFIMLFIKGAKATFVYHKHIKNR